MFLLMKIGNHYLLLSGFHMLSPKNKKQFDGQQYLKISMRCYTRKNTTLTATSWNNWIQLNSPRQVRLHTKPRDPCLWCDLLLPGNKYTKCLCTERKKNSPETLVKFKHNFKYPSSSVDCNDIMQLLIHAGAESSLRILLFMEYFKDELYCHGVVFFIRIFQK